MMRILFMGTPDFAAVSLQALIDAGHELVGVCCQPDKPQGRHFTLTPPPVKARGLTPLDRRGGGGFLSLSDGHHC